MTWDCIFISWNGWCLSIKHFEKTVFFSEIPCNLRRSKNLTNGTWFWEVGNWARFECFRFKFHKIHTILSIFPIPGTPTGSRFPCSQLPKSRFRWSNFLAVSCTLVKHYIKLEMQKVSWLQILPLVKFFDLYNAQDFQKTQNSTTNCVSFLLILLTFMWLILTV